MPTTSTDTDRRAQFVLRPDGRIDVQVTFLEMTKNPGPAGPQPDVSREIVISKLDPPTVADYRYLYDLVGGPWLWVDRKRLSAQALHQIIASHETAIYVLRIDGTAAGFFELTIKDWPVVNLAYFGLAPNAIGLGLGRWFLRVAVEQAWIAGPAKLTVNTCTLDHPRALDLYKSVGFVPTEVRDVIFDPRPFVVASGVSVPKSG